MNEIKKIYVDRASMYIEVEFMDGTKKELGPDDCEMVFENDEREIEEIVAEQKEIGRKIKMEDE